MKYTATGPADQAAPDYPATQAPIDRNDLRQAIVDLARIDEAGLLDELKGDIGYALLDRPTCDLDYCTLGQRINAERLADVAYRLLKVPLQDCLEAATALVTLSRQQVVLDLIAQYVGRLDGTTSVITTDGTPDAIARARQQAITARTRSRRRPR